MERLPTPPPAWILKRIDERLAIHPNHHLVWKSRSRGIKRQNLKAGNRKEDGYWRIGFGRKGEPIRMVFVHHIVYYLTTGFWPTLALDHKDLDRGNNAFSNLRQATRGQNNANRHFQKNNKLGEKGIHWSPSRARFRVKVAFNKRIIWRDIRTLDEAIRVRDELLLALHDDFARTA